MNAASLTIAATFTAEPIGLPLRSWVRWLDLPYEIRFAPYDQVFQQLLDQNSGFASGEGAIGVLLIRLQDWLGENHDVAAVSDRADQLVSAVKGFLTRTNSRLIIAFCPQDSALSKPIAQELSAIESVATSDLDGLTRVSVIASSEPSQRYGVAAHEDPLSARAAHVPYNGRYFTSLATSLARRLFHQNAPVIKAIVLDCDQTLWDGVVGEDGPLGVRVSQPRLDFQKRLLRLRDAGVLLCLCSKNEEADVWSVLERNPDMHLRREHITAAKINWDAKSENLRRLATNLNLGVESLLFLDDNPLECADVQANAPEVLTLQLPTTDDLPSFLENLWVLDREDVTDEDLARADRYRQESARKQSLEAAPTLEQFLADLQLTVEFQPLSDGNIDRAAQLTQRTNQFNFSTIRRDTDQLRLLCVDGDHDAFVFSAADRFGDYGIVGLVVFQIRGATLAVDTLLMSCRAMGRRIEHQVVGELGRIARQAGASQIEFAYRKSDKNRPALDFLDRIADRTDLDPTQRAMASASDLPGDRYHLPITELDARLARDTGGSGSAEPTDKLTATSSAGAATSELSGLLTRIATELTDADRIAGAIAQEAAERPMIDEDYVAPQSKTELIVTRVCAEVLHLDRVGILDSLATLGGSSLQLIQIRSRLYDELAVEIPVTRLFALSTVGDLIGEVLSELKTTSHVPRKSKIRHRETNRFRADQSEIAIIGMAGQFPGARNVTEFWRNLTDGVCSIRDLSDDELNLPPDSPLRENPNLVRRTANLADADKFDAALFGVFPKEAQVMDPQHRLMVQCCWHALEDAGYTPDGIEMPVGLWAGCYMDTYILASLASSPALLQSLADSFHGGDLLTELGNDKDYLATRVAYLLNLRGPAITVQTACSTSLVAVAQACQSLVSGGCEMAMAGGVTLKLPQNRGYLYTEGGMVSPDGVVRTFDASARGTVFGEGAGVVVLKRLDDAIADGDDIYAVLKGWGLNNDGHAKLGYTAPSVEGQFGAIAIAQDMAGISAETIEYAEAHGTGTSLGDPIEIDALSRAFRRSTEAKQSCAIGSLKTNIGHLDVAAGVAGLIKVSLALRHGKIPPSLHFETPNPNIDFENSPFFVNTELRDWPRSDSPRRGCLSSFGVGGTNAHVIVEEAPQIAALTPPRPRHLLALSARSQDALDTMTGQLADHLSRDETIQNDPASIAKIARTLQVGRKRFHYTRVLTATNVQEAIERLREPESSGVYTHHQVRRDVPVCLMFPGQGSQHPNMGRELYENEPVFASHVDQCARILSELGEPDLRDRIFVDPQSSDADTAASAINQTKIAQPAIFTIAYATAKLLESRGVRPAMLVGHSVGEFVAACLSGVMDLGDALRLVSLRAHQMQSLPSGEMLAVRMSETDARRTIEGYPSVAIAAINGPELCVLSGPTEAIASVRDQLETDEVICRPLHTSHAFHSSMMQPAIAPLATALADVKLRPPQIPIISSVTGQPLTDHQATDPQYWANHLRETVRFTDAAAKALETENLILVEVGPGQTLSTLVRQHPACCENHVVLTASCHPRSRDSGFEQFLLSIGRLWQAGANVDLESLYDDRPPNRIHLPGYPFEGKRYWFDMVEGMQNAKSDSLTPNSPQNLANSAENIGALEESTVDTKSSSESEHDRMVRELIERQLGLMASQLQAWSQNTKN